MATITVIRPDSGIARASVTGRPFAALQGHRANVGETPRIGGRLERTLNPIRVRPGHLVVGNASEPESIRSWLHRFASANGHADIWDVVAASKCRRRLRQDLDWDGPCNSRAIELARACRVDAGDLIPHFLRTGASRSIRWHAWLLRGKDDLSKGESSKHVICPKCVAAQSMPMWSKAWRLALTLHCPEHECWLLDRCSNCAAEFNLGRQRKAGLGVCETCGLRIDMMRPVSTHSYDASLDFLDGCPSSRQFLACAEQAAVPGPWWLTVRCLRMLEAPTLTLWASTKVGPAPAAFQGMLNQLAPAVTGFLDFGSFCSWPIEWRRDALFATYQALHCAPDRMLALSNHLLQRHMQLYGRTRGSFTWRAEGEHGALAPEKPPSHRSLRRVAPLISTQGGHRLSINWPIKRRPDASSCAWDALPSTQVLCTQSYIMAMNWRLGQLSGRRVRRMRLLEEARQALCQLGDQTDSLLCWSKRQVRWLNAALEAGQLPLFTQEPQEKAL